MRRVVVFVVLVAPVAIWLGVVAWAQSRGLRWTPASGELSVFTRLAIASGNWAVRLLPFAIIPIGLVWPITVPLLAALTRNKSGSGATRQDVVIWWIVSVAAIGAGAVAGAAFYMRSNTIEATPLLACLAWVCVVAFWLSIAAAYTVQEARHRSGKSLWQARELLGGLAVLNCFGLCTMPLLVAFAFRRGDAAVEQGHEADNA